MKVPEVSHCEKAEEPQQDYPGFALHCDFTFHQRMLLHKPHHILDQTAKICWSMLKHLQSPAVADSHSGKQITYV